MKRSQCSRFSYLFFSNIFISFFLIHFFFSIHSTQNLLRVYLYVVKTWHVTHMWSEYRNSQWIKIFERQTKWKKLYSIVRSMGKNWVSCFWYYVKCMFYVVALLNHCPYNVQRRNLDFFFNFLFWRNNLFFRTQFFPMDMKNDYFFSFIRI